MASSALGTKRECPKCGAKFYDLGADPVVCPKCNHTLKAEGKIKAKRAAAKRSNEPPKPKKAPPKRAFADEDTLTDTEAPEEMEEGEGAGELEDLDELDDAPEVISLEEVEEHQEEAEADPNSDDAEDGMFIEEMTGEATLFDALDPDEEEAEEDEDGEETDEDEEDDEDKPARKRKKK